MMKLTLPPNHLNISYSKYNLALILFGSNKLNDAL